MCGLVVLGRCHESVRQEGSPAETSGREGYLAKDRVER